MANNNDFTVKNLVGMLLAIVGYLTFYEGLSGWVRATFSGMRYTDLMIVGVVILVLTYFIFNRSPAIFNRN